MSDRLTSSVTLADPNSLLILTKGLILPSMICSSKTTMVAGVSGASPTDACGGGGGGGGGGGVEDSEASCFGPGVPPGGAREP